MKEYFKYLNGDKAIWVIVFLLLLISILSVYSFVPILVRTEGGTPLGYMIKHISYIAIGAFLMYWIHNKDPKYLAKLSKFIFVVSIALLIFTFFFGVRVNNAARWIRIPILGLTFQSSDFAKLALMIFLSHRLVSKQNDFNSWKKGFLPVVLPIIIVVALIAKDNFSTAAIIFLISLLLLFVGKVPFGKTATFMGIGVGLLGFFVLLHLSFPSMNFLPRFDTWMNRLTGDSEMINQSTQALTAKLAIHNGGYFGVGPGHGDLKLYTPEAYADFFYSSFVEEFGMLGGFLLVALYLFLFYRIFRIALNAEKLFETYVCIGIGLLLLSQAIVNMFVCVGIMPVTGQNMPFLAMGGSAMIMNCIALGIVLAVSNKNNDNKAINKQNKVAS